MKKTLTTQETLANTFALVSNRAKAFYPEAEIFEDDVVVAITLNDDTLEIELHDDSVIAKSNVAGIAKERIFVVGDLPTDLKEGVFAVNKVTSLNKLVRNFNLDLAIASEARLKEEAAARKEAKAQAKIDRADKAADNKARKAENKAKHEKMIEDAKTNKIERAQAHEANIKAMQEAKEAKVIANAAKHADNIEKMKASKKVK